MKNIIQFSATILAIVFLGILVSCQKPESNVNWIENFDVASKQAEAKNKYMLLDFTGSDWCPPCIKLAKEVFSQDSFKSYAKDKLILVELDFPRGKKQSAEIIKQNQTLARKYEIRGYPTIIILDSKGKLVAKTGYQSGGPDAYVAHIKALIENAGAKSR